jgi:peroxiredoxin
MSLREKLDALWQQSSARLGPGRHRLFEAFLEGLAANGMTAASLKAGEPMPGFMLPSSTGDLVASSELLERGPLVVCFFRGDWCPYCNLELQALQEALPDIAATGATLVAITPDTGAAFQSAVRRHDLGYLVLSDADNGVGLQFGVVYRVPDAIRDLYLGLGLDLEARHGNVAWFLPIPATYIVDRNGIVRHAELDIDFTHRMEPSEIVGMLRALQAEQGSGGEVGQEVARPAQPDEGVERG